MNSFLVKSLDYFQKKFPCEWKPSTMTTTTTTLVVATAAAMTSKSSGRIIIEISAKLNEQKRNEQSNIHTHMHAKKKERNAIETCLF